MFFTSEPEVRYVLANHRAADVEEVTPGGYNNYHSCMLNLKANLCQCPQTACSPI